MKYKIFFYRLRNSIFWARNYFRNKYIYRTSKCWSGWQLPCIHTPPPTSSTYIPLLNNRVDENWIQCYHGNVILFLENIFKHDWACICVFSVCMYMCMRVYTVCNYTAWLMQNKSLLYKRWICAGIFYLYIHGTVIQVYYSYTLLVI